MLNIDTNALLINDPASNLNGMVVKEISTGCRVKINKGYSRLSKIISKV